MSIIKEINLISSGGYNEVLLTHEREEIAKSGELLIFSVESDGDILSTADPLLDFDQDDWFGNERFNEERKSVRSYMVKIATNFRRVFSFSSSVATKIKVRVIRITRNIKSYLDDHSCELCKKIVSAIMRHALTALGIPTFDDLTEAAATEVLSVTQAVISKITDHITLDGFAAEIFDKLRQVAHSMIDPITNGIEQVIDIQERCSDRVCTDLGHCPG